MLICVTVDKYHVFVNIQTIIFSHTSWSRPLFFQLLILLVATSSWFNSFDISLAKTQRKYSESQGEHYFQNAGQTMTSHFTRSPKAGRRAIPIGGNFSDIIAQKLFYFIHLQFFINILSTTQLINYYYNCWLM